MPETPYQRFLRRTNNVGQVISAEDVNSLQAQSEATQRALFALRDETVRLRLLEILANRPDINVMLTELLTDASGIASLSPELVFDSDEGAVRFADNSLAKIGEVVFQSYDSPTTGLLHWYLSMVRITPPGTSIQFFLSKDAGLSWTPIQAEQTLPLEIPGISQVTCKATLMRQELSVSPHLLAFGLGFYDPARALQDGGLLPPTGENENPRLMVDLSKDVTGILGEEHLPDSLWFGPDGRIQLIFDENGRLTQVREPNETTDLLYVNERLETVLTHKRGKVVMETLSYDSAGRLTTVDRVTAPEVGGSAD